MRISLIFGGPSAERGISLNSARTAMDHLTPLGWEIIPFYCDFNCNFYCISPEQLYSNTPSDFDFKLAKIAKSLSQMELIEALGETDIVLSVIHGEYGEGGELQELLEKYKIPFVGSSSKSCRRMFDKVTASKEMENIIDRNFEILPNCCIEESDSYYIRLKKVNEFFEKENANKYVVKPATNGSSIGVAIAENPEEALKCMEDIFISKYSNRVLIERYCEGHEFTVIVFQNQMDEPVALIPTEIVLHAEEKLLTFRNKYLPSHHVEYHCPPLFDNEDIKRIQETAENLFTHFGMRDFSRIDGWLAHNPNTFEWVLYFSDFNPISGMEQDSDMFIQGSRIGFTHTSMLQYIISHAAQRYGIDCTIKPMNKNTKPKKINILFGGKTSERQVSLMSGKNVWLKMQYIAEFLPTPYFLGTDNQVWRLSPIFMFNFTVEEILRLCGDKTFLPKLKSLAEPLRMRLGMPTADETIFEGPKPMNFDEFCQYASDENAFVFIALHGGEGENGTIQNKLNKKGLAYNGSDVVASRLCMDKFETGEVVYDLKDPFLTTSPRMDIDLKKENEAKKIWEQATKKWNTEDICIKPRADGCSTGVVRLKSENDLKIYLQKIEEIKKEEDNKKTSSYVLKKNTFANQPEKIELPMYVDNLILEPFILTDEILHAEIVDQNIIRAGVSGPYLVHNFKTGWIELTVGVLERNGTYHALTPSITVVQENFLSLEEKFQGGTGVNLTPPPKEIITTKQITSIKTRIEKTANILGIQGYARIDIFFNTKTNKIVVIEANSLPALTPSTVFFQQLLVEKPPLFPQVFLSKLVALGIERQIERNHQKTEK